VVNTKVLNFRERKLVKEVDRMFDHFELNHCYPKSILVTNKHYEALLKLENEDHPRSPYEYITHYQGIRLDVKDYRGVKNND